jgi:hypothetical protein
VVAYSHYVAGLGHRSRTALVRTTLMLIRATNSFSSFPRLARDVSSCLKKSLLDPLYDITTSPSRTTWGTSLVLRQRASRPI